MKRKNFILSLLCCIVLISCLLNSCGESSASDTVSYNFDIRPILSDKCFKCHGPDKAKREAGLRLDIADSAYAPLRESKGKYAIVPFKPGASELINRISSLDPSYMMPTPESHLGVLNEKEIALIKKWVANGARYEPHWAFTPPQKKSLPDIANSKWVKNEIDHFILDKLNNIGLTPNEPADKERLLKRASFDITGLPPSVDMMDAFVHDKSPNAYAKALDRLLQMPQYGEKMAVHWMDVARYSDSYGYQDDNYRTQWPWRDWVIHAFNLNLPYNTFLTLQIAGDMVPNANKETMLATAFFRNHKYTEEGGVIPEEYRIEYLIDKTKTYSKGILGLTLECAQCHDHKYDPFSQKDYYATLAFFNNTNEQGYEGDVNRSKLAKMPVLVISADERAQLFSYINTKDTGKLSISVLSENKDSVRKTYILNRGVYDQPGASVTPAAIPAVMKFDTKEFSQDRLGLAAWTVSKKNPLTARVFVNQMWQEIFGRGLLKTSGDFGMQGELPSHPALLDWLAVDFMEHNWDIKYLLKKILLSATYMQSAKISKQQYAKDPENIYLSHAPRIKLKAEFIRDMYLTSSGLLVKEIGGPSVKSYQPKGVWEAASSGRGTLSVYKQDHNEKLYRRGLYSFIKLTVPPPNMIVFDASNRDQCEVRRLQTNTPLQALIMMNEPAILEASRVLAENTALEKAPLEKKITGVFRKIICRMPDAKEQAMLMDYYKAQIQFFEKNKVKAKESLLVGEYSHAQAVDPNTTAALMKTISLIYNLEEALVK